MSLSREFALLAAIFFIAAAPLSIDANAATLSLVGSSTKLCQLIGDADWATGKATAAQTLSKFGLDAVDLGFPVESGSGKLFFLFGDAMPTRNPPKSNPAVPPNDAVGWTTRTAAPDSASCLDLQLATSAPKTFAHPTVLPAIKQGAFNVPSGGVFLDAKFNVFFWTNHCPAPATLTPDSDAPLSLPAPSKGCAETSDINSIGLSVLAQATAANPVAFGWTIPPDKSPLPDMPSGFVYVSATNATPQIAASLNLPGIPVFGVPRYRASVPYVAIAPSATFGDPQTWSFFSGSAAGKPIWVTRQQWESGRNANGKWKPPAGAEIYEPVRTSERCIGEHSVTWNAPLHVWLLLYNCAATGNEGPPSIEARFAPEPWGPWSTPIVMLSAAHDPKIICTLIMRATGCPGLKRRSYWKLANDKPQRGGLYAPFAMDRFTKDATPAGAGQPKRATIYWLLSTWNPYVVVVMQSTLELKE